MTQLRNRPRIGIDVTPAVTQGGGIGRYTRELVKAFAKGNDEFYLRLFSAKQPKTLPVEQPLPTSKSVNYRQVPLSTQWLYRIWYRLRIPIPVQWLVGSIDLYHSPDFVLPPVSRNIPTLLTVHDLSFVHYPETFTPALVNYLKKVVPRSVGRASHVLADSESTKKDLETIWSVNPEKISVLYSGVDRRFRPVVNKRDLSEIRKKYDLGNRPYLLSVSTIQPRKNYQMLIRAFRQVSESFPHNLAIAGGRGWLFEDILAEVETQGLEDRVHFLGFVDDKDLPGLYSGASLFVFPSLYEGFGLPLLEAMSCGVPVLTSDASCLPEVTGQAAILLPPRDQTAWTHQMQRLLSETQLRTKLVAAGFIRAREFTWGKAAEQLGALYKNLLDY